MSNTFFSDDLSDLLGAPAQAAPRELPQGEAFARVRAMADQAPAAPAFKVPCKKCGGRGRFVSYSGRDCGPCFTCKGKGSFERKTNPVKLAANREKAQERKVRSAVANTEAFMTAYPAEAEYLAAELARAPTGTWGEILISIQQAVVKYGELSEGRLAVLTRGVARKAEKAAQKATVVAQALPTGLPNLRAAFDAVVSKGAKKAQMTVGDVNVSLASLSGRNPGALYVKFKGEYAGKVVGTTFQGRNAAPELMAALAVIEADPTAAIKAHAATAAQLIAEAVARGEEPQVPCGCCGILLTDPESRARGIGPICAGKWGF